MYDVNGRPPMAISTRRAVSSGVTVTRSAGLSAPRPATRPSKGRATTIAIPIAAIASALFACLLMRRPHRERLRHLESLAVLAGEQPIGFLVVDERLRLAV